MLPASESPLFLLAMAGAFTIFALLAMLLTAGLAPLDVPERSEGGQRLMASFSPAVLMVSLAFGAYVVLSLAFFTFLPAYVSAAGDAMLLPAGGIALLVPAGNILASALGSLQLEEVLPAADAAPVEDAAFQIRYYTREGLTIDATTWMQDEKHYARFVAAVDPDLVAAWSTAEQARQAAAQPPAADESADSDQPASESVVPDLATISAEQQSKMEAEAGQINAIASDWTFIIPSWKYANMAKRMDELLATKE